MIFDGIALTGSTRFGASSPGSTWTIPSVAVAGDLIFVCQLAESTSGTPPTSVTPSGWTALLNSASDTGDAGKGYRVNTSFRIIQSGDANDVVTGMNGSSKNRVCGILFHFNRPIKSLTRTSSAAQVSADASLPTDRTIAWDSVGGCHLVIGFEHCDASNLQNSNYDWTTGPIGSVYNDGAGTPDLGTANETKTWYSFYPQGSNPPSSVVMSMGTGTGDFNALAGAMMRLF